MMVTSENDDGLHAIVLAAGASTRFGSAKQLVRIAGRPMLHATVTRAVEVAGNAVIVVLGARAEELAPLLSHSPASIVINRDWREGLASSIRAGVARLPAACSGAMLLLADQAAVTAEDLRRLAGAWRRQTAYVAAAVYGATVGVPAIFPRASFPNLLQLRGDQGARALIQRNPDRVVRVPMESAGVDIDTPEDLLAIEAGGTRSPP
ncbi:MAG TPA: nucleotidyltransferase family protein [Steroidobacteraceae bacterium]|nr:nucleotidyltransferase family protein [Steroidobacteraceae bacterium]